MGSVHTEQTRELILGKDEMNSKNNTMHPCGNQVENSVLGEDQE